MRAFLNSIQFLGGERGIRTRLRYISESQILSILSFLTGNDLETKRSFFVRTCLKEPLLQCEYKYSFYLHKLFLFFCIQKSSIGCCLVVRVLFKQTEEHFIDWIKIDFDQSIRYRFGYFRFETGGI